MLRITISINADQIADYEVLNVCPSRGHKRRYHYCTYEVRAIKYRSIGHGPPEPYTEGEPLATIHHQRWRGAEFLAAKAMICVSSLPTEETDERRSRNQAGQGRD